jgi:hypothetical protein
MGAKRRGKLHPYFLKKIELAAASLYDEKKTPPGWAVFF